jgi:hypothetical protein
MADSGTLGYFKLVIDMNPDATIQAFRSIQDSMQSVSASFTDTNTQADEMTENMTGCSDGLKQIYGRMDDVGKKQKENTEGSRGWLGTIVDLSRVIEVAGKAFDLVSGAVSSAAGSFKDLVIAGGNFSEQKTQFENLAASYGQSGEKIVTMIQGISSNTIGMSEAMRIASTAISNGFSEQNLGQALTYAKRFSEASGQSFEQVASTIVNSLAKGRFAALAEFGIIATEGDKVSDVMSKMTDQLKRFGDAGPNIADSVTSLGNTWKEFRLELGKAIQDAPALNKMFSDLAKFAFDFVKSIDFTAVTKFVEGAVRAGQEFMAAFYEPIREGLAQAWNLFVQFATPIVDLAGVIASGWSEIWDGIGEGISGAESQFSGFFSDIGAWFTDLFDFEPTEEGFKKLFKNVVDGLSAIIQFGAEMWNSTLDGFNTISGIAGQVFKFFIEQFVNIVDFINYIFNDLVPSGFEKAVSSFSSAIQIIGSAIPGSLLDLLGIDSQQFNRDLQLMKDGIDGWASGMTAGIRQQGQENTQVIDGFMKGVDATTEKMATAFDGTKINTQALYDANTKVKDSIDAWGPLYKKNEQAVKEFAGVSKEELQKRAEAEKQAQKEALEMFKEIQKERKEAFVDQQKDELAAFKSNLDEQKRAFQDQQKDAADAFKERQKTESDAFKDNQKKQAEAFKQAQDEAKKAFTAAQKDAAEAFRDNQKQQMDALKQRLNDEKKAFQEQLKTAADAFKTRQEAEKQAFTEGLKKQTEAFKDAQKEQAEAFKDTQTSALNAFKSNQKEALDIFKDRMKSEKDAFKDAQKTQLDQLKDRLSEEKRAFKDRQDAAKDAYKAELDAARSAFEKIMDERKKMDARQSEDISTGFERKQEDALTQFKRKQEDELDAFKSRIKGRDDSDELIQKFRRNQEDALTKFKRDLDDQKTEFKRAEQDKQDAAKETYKAEEDAFKQREEMQLKAFLDRQEKENVAFEKQQAITLETLVKTQSLAAESFDKMQSKATDDFAKSQEKALEVFTERQKKEADAFAKKQQETLRAFEEKQKAQISAFEGGQKAALDAFQKGQQTLTDAFTRRQDETLKGFEKSQRDAQKAFERSQEAARDAFDRQQKEAASSFETRQRDELKSFEKGQQEALKAFTKDQEQARRSFDDGQKKAMDTFQRSQRDALREFEKAQKEQLKAFEDGKGADRELQKAMAEKYLKGSEGVAGAIGDYTNSLKKGVKVYPSGAAVNGALQELIEFVLSRAVERAQEENIPVAGA